MKIAIIGNAGSGKSTLACQLHSQLGLPLYHLDQYFWKPGWQEPDRSEFEKIHNELCDRQEWIIEGCAIRLFEYRLKKADVVIFLDISPYRCLYRVIKRALFCWGSVRESSAPGCPEKGPDMKFLKFIWNFNSARKPMIEKLLSDYKDRKRIFIAKNSSEMSDLVKQLKLDTLL